MATENYFIIIMLGIIGVLSVTLLCFLAKEEPKKEIGVSIPEPIHETKRTFTRKPREKKVIVGPIERPTAEQLKREEEPEIIKENKDAMREALKDLGIEPQ